MEAIKSWIADSFARENEALTKALQISLSDDTSASSLPRPPPPPAELVSFGPAPNRTGIGRAGRPIPCPPSEKIAKRRPRRSNRSATTYINADPADFRRMVQEVTGIQFGEGGVPVEKTGRLEPDRTGMLLDRTAVEVCDTVGPVGDGPLFEFEPFQCFPTLESWGM